MDKKQRQPKADQVSSKKEETSNQPSSSTPSPAPKKPILYWKPHVHITKRPIDILITAFFFFSFICTYFFAIQQAIGKIDYPIYN